MIDFAKLCDSVEMTPTLSESTIVSLYKTFRKDCVDRYNDVDPTPGQRESLFLESKRDVSSWFGPQEIPEGTKLISRLTHTPRILKAVFRRTSSVWDNLHGEVNFDELFVVNLLRETSPPAFNFLVSKYDDLLIASKAHSSSRDTDSGERWLQYIDEWWEKAFEGSRYDPITPSLLLSLLIPFENESKYFHSKLRGLERNSLQGIQSKKPTNYLQRILSGGIQSSDVRDQEVLKLIRGSERVEGSLDEISERMCASEEFTEKWEHFAGDFPSDKLLPLVSRLFEREGDLHRKEGRPDFPSLSVWRIANKREFGEAGVVDWLKSEIGQAVESDIALANNIYYYWTSVDYGIAAQRQRQDVRNSVRKHAYEVARKCFEDSGGEKLKDALGGANAHIYQLYHLVFATDQGKDAKSLYSEPSDWSWLAPTIVDMIQKDPDMTPHVAALVNDGTKSAVGPSTVSSEVVNQIFGESSGEVLRLLDEWAKGARPNPE